MRQLFTKIYFLESPLNRLIFVEERASHLGIYNICTILTREN